MALIIPQTKYETYLTSAISSAVVTIPVATCPASSVTSGYVMIDNEIIKFAGNSNPGGAGNLTSCVRGLALSGTTETDAGLGVAHPAGTAVKMTDVHYYYSGNIATTLASQSDVAIVAAASGDVLRFDGSKWVDYADTNYAAASHNHSAAQITSGTLAIAQGGTNAGDAATAFGNLKQAATTSATGVVELAIASEINTGTDTTRAIPVDQFVASNRNVRYIYLRVQDPTTDWPANGTTAQGGDFEVPFTGTITEIGGFVDTAGTTGVAVVDVNLNGTTLMTSNKVSFDSTEKTSRTAATAPTLTTTAVTAGDIITVDVDTNHTTKAKGLTIRLGIRMT